MFLLNGAFSSQALAGLVSAGDATALRRKFEFHVKQFDGQLVHFFFVAGDTTFIAVIDLPRPVVSLFYYQLVNGGLVRLDSCRLNRVRRDASEVDEDIRLTEQIPQPWPIPAKSSERI